MFAVGQGWQRLNSWRLKLGFVPLFVVLNAGGFKQCIYDRIGGWLLSLRAARLLCMHMRALHSVQPRPAF
eukprot:1156393-Pelagomonas_calceolata.AAC.10